MLSVTKRFEFEASHKLPNYDGDCKNLHGHSYLLDVTVGGRLQHNEGTVKEGMIIDFKDLKSIVEKVAIDKYDHSYLNDFFENPTAEIMVKQIALDIIEELPAYVYLKTVKLWETRTSYAEISVLGGNSLPIYNDI